MLRYSGAFFIVTKKLTLGKKERLKGRKQTETLFKTGKKLSAGPIRIFYCLYETTPAGVLFGAGVSQKMFKKAVDRNRVKRLIRECYRIQKLPLLQLVKNKKSQVHLFFIYTGKEIIRFQDMFVLMGRALEKLVKQINDPR